MTFTFAAVFLALAPLAALVCLLAAGRYPGERTLETIRRFLEPDAPRAPAPGRPKQPVRARGARGSELIAARLAGRAPPAVRSIRT